MNHPFTQFHYCPKCGSHHFEIHDEKSKKCVDCGFVYYFNPATATVALIINDQNELLVCRRAKEPAKGTLDLPGGFIDMNETAEEGVAREVKEETGLTMKNPRLVGVKQFWAESGRYIVFLFSATKFTGDLRSSNEGEVEWFTKEEMKNINLVNHFFEHLAVFEGDYSEYIYEPEDSIKIY